MVEHQTFSSSVASKNNLTVSAAFHPNNKEAKRELKVNFSNETLSFCSESKYFGVTLDRSLTYHRHLESLCKKLTSRVALLRRLAGSGWGAGATTLRTATLARYRTVRRRRFGDGTFRRWWSQMFYAKKMHVFKILWRFDYKRCLLDRCFCCHPDGQCSFPSVRILKELIATVTTCVKKYGLWRLFLLAWGVCEFTQKLSLDSIYWLIFHVDRGASRGSVLLSCQTPLHNRYSALKADKISNAVPAGL